MPDNTPFVRFGPKSPFEDATGEILTTFVHRFRAIEEDNEDLKKKLHNVETNFKEYKEATNVEINALKEQIEELKTLLREKMA